MATATALGLQVARRVHDASQVELTAAAYLDFINMAIDDLVATGWLQPQTEDETITIAASDYDYDVPSGFAYIQQLVISDSAGEYPLENIIPFHQWRIALDAAATPEIYFFPDAADLLTAGRSLKVIGQKRPSQVIAGGDTIVPGMEAFIRERAVAYAAEFLAPGISELSQYRARQAEVTWAKSEKMLGNHPMEFRVRPNSRFVEGR